MGSNHSATGLADCDREAWSDWLGFCEQLGKPIFPSATSNAGEAATRAQILVFVAYTTARLSATADAALAKVQAIGRQLEQRGHPNYCFGAVNDVVPCWQSHGSQSVAALRDHPNHCFGAVNHVVPCWQSHGA